MPAVSDRIAGLAIRHCSGVDTVCCLLKLGDLNSAATLLAEQEQLCEGMGDSDALAICLGNQGEVALEREDIEHAMRLFVRKEKLCRALGNQHELCVALSQQGLALRLQDRLDEAMQLHRQAEHMARELGDLDMLQVALGNGGLVAAALGKDAEALEERSSRTGIVSDSQGRHRSRHGRP